MEIIEAKSSSSTLNMSHSTNKSAAEVNESANNNRYDAMTRSSEYETVEEVYSKMVALGGNIVEEEMEKDIEEFNHNRIAKHLLETGDDEAELKFDIQEFTVKAQGTRQVIKIKPDASKSLFGLKAPGRHLLIVSGCSPVYLNPQVSDKFEEDLGIKELEAQSLNSTSFSQEDILRVEGLAATSNRQDKAHDQVKKWTRAKLELIDYDTEKQSNNPPNELGLFALKVILILNSLVEKNVVAFKKEELAAKNDKFPTWTDVETSVETFLDEEEKITPVRIKLRVHVDAVAYQNRADESIKYGLDVAKWSTPDQELPDYVNIESESWNSIQNKLRSCGYKCDVAVNFMNEFTRMGPKMFIRLQAEEIIFDDSTQNKFGDNEESFKKSRVYVEDL